MRGMNVHGRKQNALKEFMVKIGSCLEIHGVKSARGISALWDQINCFTK